MAGPLTNARWESFVQLVVGGMSAKRAYERAGFRARGNAAAVQAMRLRRNPRVAARIAELQAGTAERAAKTRDDAVRDIEGIAYNGAVKPEARVKAHALLAKMQGWEKAPEPSDKPQRHEVEHRTRIEELSSAELERAARAHLGLPIEPSEKAP